MSTRELSPSMAVITKGDRNWKIDHSWILYHQDQAKAIFPNVRSAMGFTRAMTGHSLPWVGDQEANPDSPPNSSTILEATDERTGDVWVLQRVPFMPWAKEVGA
jgi:hypothetical protein